jgi:hypothetical protein
VGHPPFSSMEASYQTAFEIGLRSFPWAFFAIPVGFVIVGSLLIRFPRGKQIRQAVGGILVIFSIFGIVLIGGGAIADFLEYRSAYARGDFSVIEGTVYNFHPMPYEGHQQESFTVNGVSFYYSDFDSSPCFHNSASHGGPIRPGLAVRIAYHRGCILRLDIRRVPQPLTSFFPALSEGVEVGATSFPNLAYGKGGDFRPRR